MPPPVPEQLSTTIEILYRSASGRVLATLVRLLGDLDLAEEAMHEAFATALESWPHTGIPDNPRPWLISTARFKAIDGIRRRARFDGAQRDLVAHMEARVTDAPSGNAVPIADLQGMMRRASGDGAANELVIFLKKNERGLLTTATSARRLHDRN